MDHRAAPSDVSGRDSVIDAVRAISLLVVVVWHWVFTSIVWDAAGPHATNPIGSTRGLWLATWLLQVMPLFFFAGGYVHGLSWEKSSHGWRWVWRRLRALLLPAASLLIVAAAAWRIAAVVAPEATWVGRGVLLMVSPLWFLVVYAILVVGMPLWRWLHDRLVEVAVVALAGVAVLVDVLRFSYEVPGVEWVNMVVVWAISHQLGFFYDRLVAAPRRFAWSLALGGFVGLFGLTNMNLYPRSMVGVPGEAISNMAPPTLAIAALTVFQVGVLLLNHERITRWASAGLGQRIVERASANAMQIFLWHAPGFAVVYGLWRYLELPGQNGAMDAAWWLWRPLWFVLPIVPTMLLSSTVGKLTVRGTAAAPLPVPRPEAVAAHAPSAAGPAPSGGS